jgi:hypothetical protein
MIDLSEGRGSSAHAKRQRARCRRYAADFSFDAKALRNLANFGRMIA